jgi:cupin 2 domain-containing protein
MNLFDTTNQRLPDELVSTLVNRPGLRIERIVSQGHNSPNGFWYDQDEHEWVVLLQGAATLRYEESIVALRPGDWQLIPAHRKHRVDWTDPEQTTIWLAVFYRD